MSESNNVKFVEANGKWLWKRYGTEGSVISRSQLFDTEREAREDYQAHGNDGQTTAPSQSDSQPQNIEASEPTTPAPDSSNDAGSVVPEGDVKAGTASPDASQPSADQTV
jgi:hypothetical protein